MTESGLRELLLSVEKPARYAGGELNVPDMDKPAAVRMCMIFPDLYEVGMSNLGMRILYHMQNDTEGVVCERCFAPALDFAEKLKEKNLPLFSIETKKPLKDFDLLGFSVGYELLYTNILYILELAGIPFRAKDRDESYPLLIAGGPCMVNPEPIADFFDALLIGEGEKNLKEFTDLYKKHRNAGFSKKEFLAEAAKLDGVYVPDKNGFLTDENGNTSLIKVKRSAVADFDKAYYPVKPVVPNMQIIHDRAVLELFRGCQNGCRFCQACFYYRPMRFRSPETLLAQAEQVMKNTGYEELGLSSLSTGDYNRLGPLINGLSGLSERMGFKLSLPSLRLDSFDAHMVADARKSSLTFAPEAGTQRLRNVINKNISDADIDKSIDTAINDGVRTIKLYFMIGLPTETDEDILGIAETVKRIKSRYAQFPKRNKALNISVSTAVFIPKPLTPFQWEAQISYDEMLRRQQILKESLRIKGVRYSWHGAETAVIEAVLARGDRGLSALIEGAYKNGARFDAWNEHFDFGLWMRSVEECKSEIAAYTGAQDTDKPCAWSFIDNGVSEKYLLKERENAYKEVVTRACGPDCAGCGANALGACF